jgi:hypothetical protein
MLWPALSQSWISRKVAVQIMFNFVYDYKPLLLSHAPTQPNTHTHTLLGAFTKLQKVTSSFVISFRLSVWPRRTTLLTQDRFSWHLIFECFSKISPENLSFIKIWQEQQVLYMKPKKYIWSYVTKLFLRVRNVSDRSCRENQNTYFMFNNFFSKIMPFMR